MSATLHTSTTRPMTGSWLSVHPAATLVAAVLVAVAVVLAVMLLASRDAATVPVPSLPELQLTDDVTSQDCGTISAPVPC